MNQPVGEINICRNFKSLFSRAIKSELFILLLLFTFCTAITVLILPIVNYRKAILKFAASLEINKNHDDSISDPIQRKFKEFFDKQLSLEIKNQSTLCLLQKEQEISMLAKQVSHDLKSPLSAANLALSKIETSDAYAKDLLENCLKRINEISSDVLLRSKKNSKLAMSIDLNSFISKIIAEKEMEYGNIFRLRFSNSNHILRGDEKELSRILSNLINNAWQANLKKNQTVIELNVKETDCAVFIEVKDFGGGISSEILEKLNSQEIRPTTYGKTSETESGLGLGLFHARNYIKEIGGSFKIESQQEKGTIAEIGLTKLPIQRSIFP
jgi:signal transduction histidine kinase